MSIYIAVLMHISCIYAQVFDSNVADLQLSAEMSRDSLLPGEPAFVTLQFTNVNTNLNRPPASFVLYFSQVQIKILDKEGKVLAEPDEDACRTAEGREIQFVVLRPGEEKRFQFVVNEWCSTDLAAGEYRLLFSYKQERWEYEAEPPMIFSKEFPIRIRPRDDDALRQIFTELLRKAACKECGTPVADAQNSLEMLVYATAPLALPFQLQLLDGRMLEADAKFYIQYYITLADQFAQLRSVEACRGMIELLTSSEPKTVAFLGARRPLAEGERKSEGIGSAAMAGAVCRLKDADDPAIRAMCGEYIERYGFAYPTSASLFAD